MPPVSCIFSGVAPRCGVGEQILAILTLAGIAVGMRPQDVAAHAENLTPAHIEVNTQSLRRVDAVISAESTEAVAIAVRKTELVDIVEIAQKSKLIIVPESVHIKRSHIAVVSAVTALGRTEIAVFHTGLHSEIDHCFLLAVVNTGHACKIALALYHLQFVHHIDRQVF